MKHHKLTSVKNWIVIWAVCAISYIIIKEETSMLQLATLLATIPLAYIPTNVFQKKIEMDNQKEEQ